MQASELYDSIFTYVSAKVVAHHQSILANAVLKYDVNQGVKVLVFENQGNHSFGTAMSLQSETGRSCRVSFEYDQGTQFCVGKERTMQWNSSLTLWITPRTPGSWELVADWMNSCLQASRQQVADRLTVFTLQQTSTDWIPEWKFSTSRPIKSSDGHGLNYYISRSECDLIYRDAKDFMDSMLCCYHVHGPSGSGKSEFAAWLAGKLHVPLYILDLTCPGLNDSRLLSIAGYAGFHHCDPVVLLVDEFQAIYKKLSARSATTGITLEGLHQFIQSAGSLQNGVLILCGLESPDVLDDPTTRRIHKSIELTAFTAEQLCTMAVHFLLYKTPDVNWPTDISEVIRNILFRRQTSTLQTIDAMMEFIRQRLTATKDQVVRHENQWVAFLDILFQDHLENEVQDDIRDANLRKRCRSDLS